MKHKGKFIVFEGIDGCGKTELMNWAYNYLKNKGLDIIKGREPGGVEVSEKIRKILLDPRYKNKLTERTELALFEASRSQYVKDFLIPNLLKNKIILSDRFCESTIAYQGFGRGISLQIIELMNKYYTYNINPDLTFIIDVPVSMALERIEQQKTKKDRFEKEERDFHEKVRQGYLWIVGDYKRCVLVDNSGSIKDAREKIKEHIDVFLEKYFKSP